MKERLITLAMAALTLVGWTAVFGVIFSCIIAALNCDGLMKLLLVVPAFGLTLLIIAEIAVFSDFFDPSFRKAAGSRMVALVAVDILCLASLIAICVLYPSVWSLLVLATYVVGIIAATVITVVAPKRLHLDELELPISVIAPGFFLIGAVVCLL